MIKRTYLLLILSIFILALLIILSLNKSKIETDIGIVQEINKQEQKIKVNYQLVREYFQPDYLFFTSKSKFYKVDKEGKAREIDIAELGVGDAIELRYKLKSAEIIKLIIN